MSYFECGSRYNPGEFHWNVQELHAYNLYQYLELLQMHSTDLDLWETCIRPSSQFLRVPEALDLIDSHKSRPPLLFEACVPAHMNYYQQVNVGFLRNTPVSDLSTVFPIDNGRLDVDRLRLNGDPQPHVFTAILAEQKQMYEKSRSVATIIYCSLSRKIQLDIDRGDPPLKMLIKILAKYDSPSIRADIYHNERYRYHDLCSDDCVSLSEYIIEKQDHARRAAFYGQVTISENDIMQRMIDGLSGNHEYIKNTLKSGEIKPQPTNILDLERAILREAVLQDEWARREWRATDRGGINHTAQLNSKGSDWTQMGYSGLAQATTTDLPSWPRSEQLADQGNNDMLDCEF